MEQRKAQLFSLGRAHISQGTSGDGDPGILYTRYRKENETPLELLEAVDSISSNARAGPQGSNNVILCESFYLNEALKTRKRYEQYIEQWLESGWDRIFIINASISAMYGIGVLDGIVADLGMTQSTIFACEQGDILHKSVQTLPSKGSFFKNLLNMSYNDLLQMILASEKDEELRFALRSSTMDVNVDWFMRKHFKVNPCVSDCEKHTGILLPDGQRAHSCMLNSLPDLFFNTQTHRELFTSLATEANDLVNASLSARQHIKNSSREIYGFGQSTSCMSTRILLCGGYASIHGIHTRLHEEFVQRNVPMTVLGQNDTGVNDFPSIDPQILDFKGISILGEYLPLCSYISKKEYAESGKRIVEAKLRYV